MERHAGWRERDSSEASLGLRLCCTAQLGSVQTHDLHQQRRLPNARRSDPIPSFSGPIAPGLTNSRDHQVSAPCSEPEHRLALALECLRPYPQISSRATRKYIAFTPAACLIPQTVISLLLPRVSLPPSCLTGGPIMPKHINWCVLARILIDRRTHSCICWSR